jgi:dTDP-glucose 4,6-dehydratase
MIIYVDIDETICKTPKNRDYTKSMPILSNIEKINELYDEGHEVVYWTARGTGSGIDWLEHTKNQLKEWGVKSHDVKVGKPMYDIFICDKALNTERFFRSGPIKDKNIISLTFEDKG